MEACAVPVARPTFTPSAAFLLPFVVTAAVYAVVTSVGLMPPQVAPMFGAGCGLYVGCMSCALMDERLAVFTAVSGLACVTAALFALPFAIGPISATGAAWLPAADLGLVCMFAADAAVRFDGLGRQGRTITSAAIVQTVLLAVVFAWGTVFAAMLFAAGLLVHAFLLHRSFAADAALARARVIADR